MKISSLIYFNEMLGLTNRSTNILLCFFASGCFLSVQNLHEDVSKGVAYQQSKSGE